MKGKKERLDVLLVERGLAETREKAKRAIMAGLVYSNDVRLEKPGEKVPADIPLQVKGNPLPYVSRGGLKLEKALREFHISVQDKIVLDIGASTGGFTDCALQHGARLSYAVDVGYNQLAWKLRQDERVVVMERTNFRYVTPDLFTKGLPEVAVIDVSFISLRLILPVVKTVIVPGGDVIALVKPQFEAGKENVGKKGIVRDPDVHREVLESIVQFACAEGFDVLHLSYSPITGGDGNIEFLLHAVYPGGDREGENRLSAPIVRIVNEAHDRLRNGERESDAE
ncbi:TlyA family rRNA (cytidine-2'-O)-methyltransferase [Geobacillus sp. 46C-IIa]|uniref:TlyA family RNA methyltransferase n=1 Tax=Geobacillus sp. 46C-IIa TaxID=1963025 RepID=UPI0009C067BE|nr:TlyA family RNA methyltransferase [Geobacillus sp. 46C-IIa]OQP05741.1 TlyA family rRNA (cytidine-2'-O)-methyltransferase [Geobacillus sp. 46C-IIa]QNU28902.1 TlyA family RNA methyltransferase [Geobacillus sp. 46C-IIa]